MNFFFFLTSCLLFSCVSCFAQSTIPDSTHTEEEMLINPHILPEFPGGQQGLRTYLSKNMRYPAKAMQNQVEGKVYVHFVIDAEGYVTDVRIVKGIGYGCDEEALRVVTNMPRWKPGMYAGKQVAVKYTLPISFSRPKQIQESTSNSN